MQIAIAVNKLNGMKHNEQWREKKNNNPKTANDERRFILFLLL